MKQLNIFNHEYVFFETRKYLNVYIYFWFVSKCYTESKIEVFKSWNNSKHMHS